MKKSILILLLTVGIFIHGVFAQDDKQTIAIIPFTFSSSTASMTNMYAINEAVSEGFIKTKRFNVVDRNKMAFIEKEKELQTSEGFLDGEVVDFGKNLGAQLMISGHLSSLEIEHLKDSQGTDMGYQAVISLTLKVIDVETGEVVASETITPKAGSKLQGMVLANPKTPEKALRKTISKIEGDIDKFVSENFSMSFIVVEVLEGNSKEAKKILISGGSGFGLKKGKRMEIYEEKKVQVGGKTIIRKKSIAKVKIEKVEDENFSICKVKSGGTQIAKMMENGVELKVKELN